MERIFVSFIIFAVCVKIYLTDDLADIEASKKAHPFANLKPFNMEDFSKPPEFELNNCYHPFIDCLKDEKVRKPVCAFQKDHGLTTMPSECDVHFKNCLVREEDVVEFGEMSREDIFYYNGKNLSCLDYFKQTKSLKEASLLYFKPWLKDDTGTEMNTTETTTE